MSFGVSFRRIFNVAFRRKDLHRGLSGLRLMLVQKITDALSKPLVFALLMGALVGTLTYYVGTWSVAPHRYAEKQAISLLADEVITAFFQGERTGSDKQTQTLLSASLWNAVRHPNVLSATVLSTSDSIVAMASKNRVISNDRSEVFKKEIQDHRGRKLALITMALHSNHGYRAIQAHKKAVFVSILGFLLGFSLCYGTLQKANVLVPQLKSAFKMVSLGHLDVQLPAVNDPEYHELSESFDQMLEGLKERERMRHSLGRIMDPKIAEILIKEDPKLGGLRRQATILFCDIRNYTSICEELSPDELQEFLNDYWKDTVEIIMEQEGTIDKFHGDGVCVIFGAPNLHADDPVRAVRAAWRLVENVEKINQRREAHRKIPIQIGIGIHTGEVIAGHIGSERRMDYTVVGDTVNVAARIEELNKKYGTKIMITDTVYEQVETYVKVKTLTLAHLRGHKRPILIHTVRDFIEPAQAADIRKAA